LVNISVLWSLAHFLFTLAFLGLLILCYENETIGSGLGVLIVYFVVFTLLSEMGPVLTWLWRNPHYVTPGVILYFLLGTLWGLFRWWWVQTTVRDHYDERKRQFLIKKEFIQSGSSLFGVSIPDELVEEWKDIVDDKDNNWNKPSIKAPLFMESKNRITNWMVWWPISVGDFFFRDFFTKIFSMILMRFRKVFESIQLKAWQGTDQDFREPKKSGE
jgi:hypothetical protein